jgi:hypothetical protein
MRLRAFTLLLAFSFWSSGVVLIRLFSSLDLSQKSLTLAAIFILTIPVVYGSIVGVRNIYARVQHATPPFSTLIALVLAMHGIALSWFPSLYGLAASSGLAATAWLLWFGSAALLMTASE